MPYGAPQPQYGAPPPPYGAPQQPPPYGYAPPPYGGGYQPLTPEQSSLKSQATVALVVNAIAVVITCFGALPSIGGCITAGIALGQVQTDPANARRLVRWSWGLLIGSVALILLVVFGFFLLVLLAAETSSDPTFHLGLR
jgi:hypothetical protein